MTLRKRRGSSSILVILTFLLLMVFSILAISSSYADYRLAGKNASWSREYYLLEGEASEFLSKVESILKERNADQLDGIEKGILSMDPEAMILQSPEALLVSRIFANDEGRRLLIELEIYRLAPDKVNIRTLRSLPEEFVYNETIEFEDVEVINND